MKKSLLGCGLVAATIGLVGCGPKDEPYKKVDRSPYELNVSDLKNLSSKTFFYRRMLGETPRYLTVARGKYPDDVKLVKLRMTENGIQIVQLDKDNVGTDIPGRFDTENNYHPILTIGGKYVDYKCSEDSYDKCTNREVVDSSNALTWDKKRYFVPDFSDIQIAEKNINDLFYFDCAVNAESSVLAQVPEEHWKGYLLDLKNGVINFELKSTYSVPNKYCIPKYAANWDIDNLSFETTEYFSLVERNKLASPGYKAIPYQEKDKSTYGFFTTTHEFRDESYEEGKSGYRRTYLNRFDPNKKEVTYYLSNSFWNKKNAIFLAATKEAEAIINTQNRLYDTGLPHINFKQAHDKRYGDLRYSFLRLFDQPLDNGLLGVANFSSDPLTGEIVSAGFNQFSGNFLGNGAYSYDLLVRNYNLGRVNPDSVKEATGKQYPNPSLQKTKLEGVTSYNHTINPSAAAYPVSEAKYDIQHSIEQAQQPRDLAKWVTKEEQRVQDVSSFGNNYLPVNRDTKVIQEPQNVKFSHLQELSKSVNRDPRDVYNQQDAMKLARDDLMLFKKRLAYDSEHNILTVDALNLGGSFQVLPKGVKGFPIDWKNPQLWVGGTVGGKLKRLKQLPRDLRHEMVLKTAAVGFVGTIIHEFGHSIGLRHNFKGSVDHANFFTKSEIAEQKAELAKQGYTNVSLSTASSSQMEYNVDMFGMGFGPYDLAAIRFGYKREIQDNLAKAKERTKAKIADWNNPNHWHSLKKFDQKRRDEWAKGINNGETRTGSVAMLSEQLEGKVGKQDSSNGYSNFIGMDFCSDGHVSLNSDCNRFDIGFNKDQIAQYYIERYLNYYRLRNTRNDRAQYFSTNYGGYIRARRSEFAHLHEFIEDSAGLEGRIKLPDNQLAVWCSGDSSGWYCDGVKARDRVTKFFLQVVSQPDAMVLFNFKKKADGSVVWSTPNALGSLPTVLSKYGNLDLSGLSAEDKLKPGQVVTQYSDAPKVFDAAAIQLGMQPGARKILETQYTPIVKVVGRSLNSSSAAVRDPEHPYSNEVDTLGIWPDRLVAMQQLVTRHTQRNTDGLTHQALVDFAPVNKLFKDMLCRMTLADIGGRYHAAMQAIDGSTNVPKAEDECNALTIAQLNRRNLAMPAGFDYKTMKADKDWTWQGLTSVDDFYTAYEDLVEKNIEPLEPYLTDAVVQNRTRATMAFGFERDHGVVKGKTNLLHALLKQVALYSTDSDTDGKESARLLREFVGIHLASDYIDGTDITIKGKKYTLTDENILAKSLYNQIEAIKTKLAASKLSDSSSDEVKAAANVLRLRLARDEKALQQLPIVE